MTTIEILYHMVCHHVILSYAMLHRRCREEEKDQVRRSRERERERTFSLWRPVFAGPCCAGSTALAGLLSQPRAATLLCSMTLAQGQHPALVFVDTRIH